MYRFLYWSQMERAVLCARSSTSSQNQRGDPREFSISAAGQDTHTHTHTHTHTLLINITIVIIIIIIMPFINIMLPIYMSEF